MTRVAILTGASGGLGKALVHELHARGWHIIAVTRHPDDCIQGEGIHVIDGDITQTADRKRMIAAAKDAGELTAIINNAATAAGSPLAKLTPEKLRTVLEVNVTSAFALALEALPELERHHGIVVNISSIVGSIPTPYLAAYSASKHALHALSVTMGLEWGPLGVRTMLVEPGFLTSRLCSDSLADSVAQGVASMRAAAKSAAGRHAVPVEIAAAKIVRALSRKKSFTFLPIGIWARMLLYGHRIVPTGVLQRIMMKRYSVVTHKSVPPPNGTEYGA